MQAGRGLFGSDLPGKLHLDELSVAYFNAIFDAEHFNQVGAGLQVADVSQPGRLVGVDLFDYQARAVGDYDVVGVACIYGYGNFETD